MSTPSSVPSHQFPRSRSINVRSTGVRSPLTVSDNEVSRAISKLTAWKSLASAAYLPATVAPVGITAGGLPVGIQIITDYLDDTTAIDIASRLESAGLATFMRPAAHLV
jgi:Asp-tRNA(Asn)/Glu-tRNA(Gln) amidotransferase A subunit family amidase